MKPLFIKRRAMLDDLYAAAAEMKQATAEAVDAALDAVEAQPVAASERKNGSNGR